MIRELFTAIGRMFTWFFVVSPWEQAIRVRLGKRVRLMGAGIYLKFPFVDRVYRQSIRRRLSIVQQQTLTTMDGHTLTLAGSVGYEITDMMLLYQSLAAPDDTIETEVANLIADFVYAHPLSECRPAAICAHVRENLGLSKYGLGREEFALTQFVAGVRTIRLLNGEPRNWGRGEELNDLNYSVDK